MTNDPKIPARRPNTFQPKTGISAQSDLVQPDQMSEQPNQPVTNLRFFFSTLFLIFGALPKVLKQTFQLFLVDNR
jgi:hypothetical protein